MSKFKFCLLIFQYIKTELVRHRSNKYVLKMFNAS